MFISDQFVLLHGLAPAVLDSELQGTRKIFLQNMDVGAPPKQYPSPAHLLAAAQHALAAVCFGHRPMCYTKPKKIGVFVVRASPPPI